MKSKSDHRFGVLLTLAYDGVRLSGFARQDNARTVAGELEGAIREMDLSASPVRGVSRTDAGVHARGQIASFDTNADIDPRGWVLGLAQHLGNEIAVVRAARVAPGYDPRHHALGKTYRYLVLQSRVRDPLLRDRVWQVHERLNHDRMREEARALLGEHDFNAFRTAHDKRDVTVRNMLRAELSNDASDPRLIVFWIEGDRFMHNMVRIIVGTLVDVGRERLDAGAVARAFHSGRREDLGITAPAHGLYLEHIDLDDLGRDDWPDQSRKR